MSRGDCLTVLAVRKPDCVIGIGRSVALEGQFANCRFFHDEEVPLPVKFTCVAWYHCPLNYNWSVTLRKSVMVTENGNGYYNVTITTCKGSCSEDSTGYIFWLDAEGRTASRVISALKQRYMLFTRLWIERFHLPVLPSLNPREVVKDFLEKLPGNNGFLKLLAGTVTDQDFRYQLEEVLKIMYREYESAMLTEPVMEVKKDAGSLTLVRQPPPTMRDNHSLRSSCTRTEDESSFVQSRFSAEEFLVRPQHGPMPFESGDSCTTVAEDVVVEVEPRGGHNSSVLETTEEATTEHEKIMESVRGGVFDGKNVKTEDDLKKELVALSVKFGLSNIISTALGMRDTPPTATCNPVQAQDTDAVCKPPGSWSPYAPAEVTKGNETDHESRETAESDMYRS